jgi:hypothetical protein
MQRALLWGVAVILATLAVFTGGASASGRQHPASS